MKKVMIGSPICQEFEILKEFLLSLSEVIKEDIEISYCFVDDNKEKLSSNLLVDFQMKNKNVELLKVDLGFLNNITYSCDENTHRWNNSLVDKVIAFKNKIIEKFLESDNEYLFFIDSDIILDKRTIINLIEADKDIIANIFWTRWAINSREEPQVWMKDFYTFYEEDSDPNGAKTEAFFAMLRNPGIYRVGGLGACTMIKRKVLEAGVNFSRIRNISFWGEDRAFCIRAEVLGFDLYVDTRQPAFHVYRKSYLNQIKEFKKDCDNKYKMRIAEVGEKAINIIESYDYRVPSDDSWKEYFVNEDDNGIGQYVDKRRKWIEENNAIGKVLINSVESKFIDNNNLLTEFILESNGYLNWKSFDEQFKVIIKFEKQRNKQWKILTYTTEKNNDFKSINITRNASLNGKLTLSMIVKNEENRYLERVLKEHKKYIDNAVIIDDGSTDKTVQIIKDILGDCNLTLVENKKSIFSNEIELRKLQWSETIKTNPEWILSLDADEIFEKSFGEDVKKLINSNLDIDGYSFRLYDFWNEDSYREDKYWYAHKTYRLFLVRYQESYNYIWRDTNQHCGRFPYNCYGLTNAISNYRLKHLGWKKEEDRLKKFKRYMELDPNGQFGNIEQYYSILDKEPNLVKWQE